MSETKTTLKLEPVEPGDYDRVKLEELVDSDMAAFAQFFQGMGNSPPTDYENFFLKTYLLYKLGVRLAEDQST